MSNGVVSRILDARDEHVTCRACTLGPPIEVRRYYFAPRDGLQAIELCDRCAKALADHIHDRVSV